MSELELVLEFEDGPEDPSDAKTEKFRECEALVGFVNQYTGANARIPQESPPQGEKGMIEIGTIILTAITSEVVGAIAEFIKERAESRYLKYDTIFIFRSGEKSLEIKSSNFTDTAILELIRKIEALIDDC